MLITLGNVGGVNAAVGSPVREFHVSHGQVVARNYSGDIVSRFFQAFSVVNNLHRTFSSYVRELS
jgi:hypothetical protein